MSSWSHGGVSQASVTASFPSADAISRYVRSGVSSESTFWSTVSGRVFVGWDARRRLVGVPLGTFWSSCLWIHSGSHFSYRQVWWRKTMSEMKTMLPRIWQFREMRTDNIVVDNISDIHCCLNFPKVRQAESETRFRRGKSNESIAIQDYGRGRMRCRKTAIDPKNFNTSQMPWIELFGPTCWYCSSSVHGSTNKEPQPFQRRCIAPPVTKWKGLSILSIFSPNFGYLPTLSCFSSPLHPYDTTARQVIMEIRFIATDVGQNRTGSFVVRASSATESVVTANFRKNFRREQPA